MNSLKSSIGVPYELIKIENPNKYSLSVAYNLGARKAVYDLLLFVHEDVVFFSEDWGQLLLKLFKTDVLLGIVGVAGSLKKSHLPTGWGTGTSAFDRINLIQLSENQEKTCTTKIASESTEKIKVIDGVFIATTKKIWEEFKFDESVSGFHLYDIDFSIRVTQKYRGIITYDILIKHFSNGNYNTDWVINTLDYHGRKDKLIYFDRDDSFNSNIRRAWYKALTYGEISKEMRIKYASKMGYDFFSIIHSFAFRFPVIGKRLFKFLSIIGL